MDLFNSFGRSHSGDSLAVLENLNCLFLGHILVIIQGVCTLKFHAMCSLKGDKASVASYGSTNLPLHLLPTAWRPKVTPETGNPVSAI